MTTNDVRLLMEVTRRQAEEVFTRQMDECNRRIELQRAATRLRCKEGQEEKPAGIGDRSGRSAAQSSRVPILG